MITDIVHLICSMSVVTIKYIIYYYYTQLMYIISIIGVTLASLSFLLVCRAIVITLASSTRKC